MRTTNLSDGIRLTRLSEKLNESSGGSYEYKTKITGNPTSSKNEAYAELVSPPASIKTGFLTVVSGTAEWDLDLRNTRWGLQLGSNGVILKSLVVNIELEDEETEEIEEKTIELKEGSIHWEKTKVTVGKFPLTLTSIIINMENSEDPSRWRYEIEVGEI